MVDSGSWKTRSSLSTILQVKQSSPLREVRDISRDTRLMVLTIRNPSMCFQFSPSTSPWYGRRISILASARRMDPDGTQSVARQAEPGSALCRGPVVTAWTSRALIWVASCRQNSLDTVSLQTSRLASCDLPNDKRGNRVFAEPPRHPPVPQEHEYLVA